MTARQVAALFVRADSIYKTMPGVDAWDMERDARNYNGPAPVVAHPPCRAWGRLRHFAKPRHDEKALAFFAVDKVRQLGGVLEHPASSTLWPAAGLPAPGEKDEFGGWTFAIDQHWWGHKAKKSTWLYIRGVDATDLPAVPLALTYPTHVIGGSRKKHGGRYKALHQALREHTPPGLAEWLVEVARRCA